MHSSLVNHSPNNAEPMEGLLATLLTEQQDMTAVERFADWHSRADADTLSDIAQTPHLASYYSKLMPATAPSAGQQYAFEVDLDACSGCKACVVACHNLNGLQANETWRKVGQLSSRDSQLPIIQHVTTACHHCMEPGCLQGCPVKAYEKDPLSGIVRHLDDQCFGCQYCVMMCPYEVPQYSATLGIVRKCDMCSQRLGLGEAPACVQACPNAAIRISLVQTEDVRNEHSHDSSSLVPTAPPSQWTQPSTRFVSSRPWNNQDLVSTEALSDEPHEGHIPLVAMLVLTQASVGMWLIMSLLLVTRAWQPEQCVQSTIVATILGIFGVHLALAHLGRPWLAFRAFLGWRTSWLSREAILFGVYMASTSISTLGFLENAGELSWSHWFTSLPIVTNLHSIASPFAIELAIVTTFVGMAAVTCSMMIYVATRRALWSFYRTSFEFMASTVGLGLGCLAISAPTSNHSWMYLLAALVSGMGLLAKFNDHHRWLRLKSSGISFQDFSARSGRLLHQQLAGSWKTCKLVWMISLGLACSLWLEAVPNAMLFVSSSSLVMLLFLGQWINRWLYFASVVTYRMPGAGS